MKATTIALVACLVMLAPFSSMAQETTQAQQQTGQAATKIIAQDVATKREIEKELAQMQPSAYQALSVQSSSVKPLLEPLKGYSCAGHHTCFEDATAACTQNC